MLIELAQMIAAIGVSLQSPSEYTVTADTCSQDQNIEYCYYRGDKESRRIIYFMHGFGDDVAGWTYNYSTGQVEKAWTQTEIVRPHIVTISKGVWWYVDAAQGKELTEFVKRFEQTRFDDTFERVLYGESMGGHNALRWALDEPELFQKLALLCPALPPSFVAEPLAQPSFAPYEFLAEQLIGEFYKDANSPQDQPLNVVQNLKESGLPAQIFLAATPWDQYGFWSGAQELQAQLTALPWIQLTYDEQEVDHCNLSSAQGLADFLLK